MSVSPHFFSFKFITYLCLLGLLCCVGFFLAVASRGSSLLTAQAFMQWLLLWNMSSRVTGLQWFWLPGSRAQAQKVWSTGLVAPRHVASSRTRDRAHVSCIGRRILCRWATWEPLPWFSWIYFLLVLLQVFNPLGINFVFFHIVLQLLSSIHQIFHTFPPLWNSSFITCLNPLTALFPKSADLLLLWNHTVFITLALPFATRWMDLGTIILVKCS